jgi:hypothetical protein
VAAIGWYAYKDENALRLSQLAVEETGMGNIDDHFARHRKRILDTLRDFDGVKTSGLVFEDHERGLQEDC